MSSQAPDGQERRASRIVAGVWIAGSYVMLGLLAAGGLQAGGMARLTTHYLGGGEIEGWLWRYWWMKQVLGAIWSAVDLDLASRIHLSLQSSLHPEFGNLFDLWTMSVPLEFLLGAPLYYNVKIVLVLAANALGAYLLARALGANRWAAWLAGVIFGFNPYFMFEISNGRVRQAIGFTCPLYMLYLWRTWTLGGTRNALLAAMWLALTTWLYLFYGMWLCFFNVIFFVWWLAARCPRTEGSWRQILLIHAVALLLILPSVRCYFVALSRGEELHEVTYFSDVPPLEQWANLGAGRPGPGQETIYSMQRFVHMSLPADFPWQLQATRVVPLVFTIFSLVPLLWLRQSSRPRDAGATQWLWLLCALVFYVLSLGPYLRIGDPGDFASYPPGIRLPYVILFKYVPFFSRLFSPVRASIMVYLAVGILVAINITRLAPRRHAALLALSLGAAGLMQMTVSGSVPVRNIYLETPAYYSRIGMQPDDGIIEMPLFVGDYTDYLQTVHGHKVLFSWANAGLPVGFPSGRVLELAAHPHVEQNPFVLFIDRLGRDPSAPSSFTLSDASQIQGLGYRWLILHERGVALFSPHDHAAQYDAILAVLQSRLGKPVLETTEIVPDRPEREGLKRGRVAVFRLSGVKK